MDSDALTTMDIDINPVSTASVAHDLTTIKTLLNNNCPIVAGFLVYASFESQTVASTGVVPMPNTSTEQLMGGHATAFAGYSDSRSCFLMRNSWGTAWGTSGASGVRGYFWLPYAYILSNSLTPALWKISSVSSASSVTTTSYLAGNDYSSTSLTRYDTVLIGGGGNFNGYNISGSTQTSTVAVNFVQTGTSPSANTATTTVSFPSTLKFLQLTGNATGMQTVCTSASYGLPALTATASGCTLRFSLTTGPASATPWFASALPSNWTVNIDTGCADPMLSTNILDQAVSIAIGIAGITIPAPSTVSQINAAIARKSGISTYPTLTLSGNNTIFNGALSGVTYHNGSYTSSIYKTSTIYADTSLGIGSAGLTVGNGSTAANLTIRGIGSHSFTGLALGNSVSGISVYGN